MTQFSSLPIRLWALVVIFGPGSVFSCGGFQLVTRKLHNCGGSTSDIKLQNFNISLSKDCFVIATGCIENKKEFSTTKVHYKISKGKLFSKEGNDDICAQLPKASDDIKVILSFLGITHACPVKPRKICGGPDTKVNLKKYEKSMGLLEGGVLKASAMVTTDAGLSCMEFEGEMIRTKGLFAKKL